MNPVLTIARATARERALAPVNLGVIAVLLLLALFRGASPWGADLFGGFSGLWFQLLTLLLGAGLLSQEMESGHAQLVLLRPLTRAQWVSGRFAGAAGVLCAAGTLAWSVMLAMAAVRGDSINLLPRLAVLPLALVHAVAWLAVFTVVGAVAPGWTNAGLVVAVYVGWKMLKFFAPIALKRPELTPVFDTLDTYVGPQDSLPIAAQLAQHQSIVVSPALWNLFGMSAAWLGAVELFKRRELARRRG